MVSVQRRRGEAARSACDSGFNVACFDRAHKAAVRHPSVLRAGCLYLAHTSACACVRSVDAH